MALIDIQVQKRKTLPKEPISIEQFLAWCEEDIWAEWVDGEVIIMSPASRKHQQIADFLSAILRIFSETKNLGLAISAPFSMRLDETSAVREPDLLFISTANLHRLKETYLDGPADIAIEIVSPESIGRDREDKFAEYEQAGIPEYWLIDPVLEQAEFYILKQGRYHLADISDGIFRSHILPGFDLQTVWLWQNPLPNTLRVLREIGIL